MKAKEKKRLILVDGSAMAYRAFFAFVNNPLRDSKGENVSAIFGMANSLLKILREQEFTHIAVCFDTAKPTFRHELYAEYKATRQKMPDELSEQLPSIKDLIAALGIPVIEEPGYEADDVIGTLTKKATSKGYLVTLISFDKDFYQLLTTENVTIYKPGRGKAVEETLSAKDVERKLGIRADQVVDYLALVGDISDNVPGIAGVGPKTAVKLLREFGSVENLIKKREQITAKKIREGMDTEQLRLAQCLVTIDSATKLSATLASLEYKGKDDDLLRRLFSDLEFTSLMGEIDAPPQAAVVLKEVSAGELNPLFKGIKDQVSIEFARMDDVLCLALGVGERVWVCDLGVTEAIENRDLRVLMKNPGVVKISSNVKSLLHILKMEETRTERGFFDLGLASYVLDPSRGSHSLDFIALRFGNESLPKKSDVIKDFEKKRLLRGELKQELSRYASTGFALVSQLEKELEQEGMERLYSEIEMPLVGVLARIEHKGMLLDRGFFAQLGTEYDKLIQGIERSIYRLAGETFNIRSTKQLQEVLYGKLKLTPLRKTKTGYSTDSDTLLALSSQHDLPKEMLKYRELYKLKSTYIDALPRLTDSDGRIHTTFIQTAAATGRLTSRNPNLQNIPARGDLGREIRKGFIAPPGRILLSCDYSQIELRILAHLSADKQLRESFFEQRDIHTRTASSIFRLPEESITREMRRRAKIVNFGIIYGMSPFGLAQELNITPEEGTVIIDSYFATYPGVKQWIEKVVEDAREKGYIETLMGRKRRIPELASDNFNTREFGKRIAINTPVQGSAADIIKRAMIRIDERLREESVDAVMVLQIHDELLFEVKKDALDNAKKIIIEEMEGVLDLSVPLVVDVGVGKNWFEAH